MLTYTEACISTWNNSRTLRHWGRDGCWALTNNPTFLLIYPLHFIYMFPCIHIYRRSSLLGQDSETD